MKEYHINKKFKNQWKKNLIDWYILNKRDLPWRRKENQNFYRIWISEVMLQQTQVSVVIPYYLKFLKKWPTLDKFFDAELEEILSIWQGLGYYKRAHNLFKAKEILRNKKVFIDSKTLKELPGIGDYIGNAISAILNDESCPVVDGNIKRILMRVFGLKENDNLINQTINNISTELTPNSNNGDYCQSLMDLANSICKVNSPICSLCPINSVCRTKGTHKIKTEKMKVTKKKISIAFVMKYGENYLVEKSKANLLHDLYCFPLSKFKIVESYNLKEKDLDSIILNWLKEKKLEKSFKHYGSIIHKFTHFDLKVFIVKLKSIRNFKFKSFLWLTLNELNEKPVSKLMLKIKEKLDEKS